MTAKQVTEADRLRLKIAGAAIRKQRLDEGIAAGAFAEEMNVSRQTLNDYEKGEGALESPIWFRIGRRFGWGHYLISVLEGDVATVEQAEAVDPDLQRNVLRSLREIG